MSAGSFMTHRLGADLADVLAAIAPVNGMLYARPIGDTRVPPNPARPISVLVFLGDADPAVLYCGRIGTSATVTSSDEAFDFWTAANGCSGASPAGTLCSGGSPTALTQHTATGCPSGISVQLYRLIRGVHAYYTNPMNDPTGTPYNPAFNSTTGVRTSEIIWNFFVAHPSA
jgi:polyhydroxybutyrate depolymerase